MRLNPTMPNNWVFVSASHSLDDRVRHRNFARPQFDAAANKASLQNRAPNFLTFVIPLPLNPLFPLRSEVSE
jgi:hypothetical protein